MPQYKYSMPKEAKIFVDNLLNYTESYTRYDSWIYALRRSLKEFDLDWDWRDFISSWIEYGINDSDSFKKEPAYTHATPSKSFFSGAFIRGVAYPIKDFTGESFYALSEQGDWLFCLKTNCALGGDWQMTHVKES